MDSFDLMELWEATLSLIKCIIYGKMQTSNTDKGNVKLIIVFDYSKTQGRMLRCYKLA